MSHSYPSRPVASINVPEVSQFSAKFHYVFFTQDEATNESGNVKSKLLANSYGFERSITDTLINKREVPRFIEFSFKPVVLLLSQATAPDNKSQRQETALGDIDLNMLYNRMVSEEEFSRFHFTGIDFQDSLLDGKLFFLTSGSVAKSISEKNRTLQEGIGQLQQAVTERLTEGSTLQDAARYLNAEMNGVVTSKFIIDSLNQIQAQSAQLIDTDGQLAATIRVFDDIKDVSFRVQINNRVIKSVIRTASEDTISNLADEASGILFDASKIQSEAIASSKPKEISESDYCLQLNADTQVVSIRNLAEANEVETFRTTARVVGYVIEKAKMTSDGLIPQEKLIINGQKSTTAIDTAVAYGNKYVYGIRTVLAVEFPMFDIGSSGGASFNAVTLLIKSRTNKVVVDCIETTPPPPPSDFTVNWDSVSASPRLLWTFPVNLQQDIKRFQVFRRASINEPFQLLKELDFDNSAVRFDNFEIVEPSLIEKLAFPKTHFIDKDFDRTKNYIYAVCCIDAHGLSSQYSMQLQVSFDKFSNKVTRKHIATSGAPKQYPNFHLLIDTFVDTMKVSGFSKMKVFFDPEYLSLTDAAEHDLGLLKTIKHNNFNKYMLQFINVDLHKSRIFNIMLDDQR